MKISKLLFSLTLIQSILISAIFIVIFAYGNSIFNAIWAAAFFVFLTIVLLMAGSTLWSIINFAKSQGKSSFLQIIPIIINVAAVIIVVCVPLNSITEQINFNIYLNQRNEVVQQVISGELSPNVDRCPGLIELPVKLQKTSKGGYIFVTTRGNNVVIFFYTFRGIPDSSRGFACFVDESVYNAQGIHDYDYYDGYVIINKDMGNGWHECSTD